MQKTRIECQGLGVPLILATACLAFKYFPPQRLTSFWPYEVSRTWQGAVFRHKAVYFRTEEASN